MPRFFVLLLACVLLLPIASANAHSRKDLKRITLQSPTLVVDQVAYYLEPYVNQRLDENGRKYRFQLWEFEDIKIKGDVAHIHVLVNDSKTTKQTPEVLYLSRNQDNTWNHIDAEGNLIEERIFSYVNPDGSISSGGHEPKDGSAEQESMQTYVMAGGVVLAGCLGIAVIRLRKAKGGSK